MDMSTNDLIQIITAGVYYTTTCTGIILNIVLLLVFFRHPDTRNPESVPLINLCFADIIYLFSPLILVQGYGTCLIPSCCRSFVMALNTYSVSSISIQRYVGLFRFKNHLPEDKGKYLYSLLIVLGVWILAAVLATTEMLIQQQVDNCGLLFVAGETTFRLVMYGVVPSVITAVFYIISAYKMRSSVRQLISVEANATLLALQDQRRKSARVFIALAICFAVTYLPAVILSWIHVNFMSHYLWFDIMTTCLMILSIFNPLFNPIVLCVASSKLRKLYKKCLCCCCCCCFCKPTEVNDTKTNTAPRENQCTKL